jgi:N-acetyl-anhydromuramyl-L-alanine amidase AmpD
MLTDNKKKEIREKIRKIGKTVIMENDGSYSYAEDLDTNQIDQLTALCESIRAEVLKEVEGIIGKDDIKVENKDDDEETWCDTCGNYYGGEYSTECECDTRNALRKEQRAVLAKLSQEEE